jgi:hypothetical protein
MQFKDKKAPEFQGRGWEHFAPKGANIGRLLVLPLVGVPQWKGHGFHGDSG